MPLNDQGHGFGVNVIVTVLLLYVLHFVVF